LVKEIVLERRYRMHLIILGIIAFFIGYLLAGSKYSKSIDDASGKVAETSKSWAEKAADWWRGVFKKTQPANPPVVKNPEKAAPEPIQTAEKRPSRRKSGDEKVESNEIP
jgi:hypothetical protein